MYIYTIMYIIAIYNGALSGSYVLTCTYIHAGANETGGNGISTQADHGGSQDTQEVSLPAAANQGG